MTVLEDQLGQLLDHSISRHGYWLKNNIETIKSDLESGIVSYGLKGMIARLDDFEGAYTQRLYDKIEEARR